MDTNEVDSSSSSSISTVTTTLAVVFQDPVATKDMATGSEFQHLGKLFLDGHYLVVVVVVVVGGGGCWWWQISTSIRTSIRETDGLLLLGR
jgi:hypothetical protein